jgi:hypothetical protein
MCGQKLKRWFRISMPYLVYSQIWLNRTRDDRHLFRHLPIHDGHFGYKQKFLKKNTYNMWLWTHHIFREIWCQHQLICSKVDTRPTFMGDNNYWIISMVWVCTPCCSLISIPIIIITLLCTDKGYITYNTSVKNYTQIYRVREMG